jgi:hypothetical protein
MNNVPVRVTCGAHSLDEFAVRNRNAEVDADRLHDESGNGAFAQHRLHLVGGFAIKRRLYLPAMRQKVLQRLTVFRCAALSGDFAGDLTALATHLEVARAASKH